MESAYSMIQRRTISATAFHLRRTPNYWELGLTCPGCGEPVYWKSGGYSATPHFAHFQKTSLSENCSLRVDGQSSTSGDESSSDFSLLLKDIQKELINIILNPKIFGDIIVDLNEEIKLTDPEERAANLLQLSSAVLSLRFDEAYEVCKEEGILENPLNLDNPFNQLLFGMDVEKWFRYLTRNKEIGRELVTFLGKRSNRIILHNLAQVFTQQVLKDFPDKDPALEARSRILKEIAKKDWQKLLGLENEFNFSTKNFFGI